MNTVSSMIAELTTAKTQGVKFVTYGDSDLGIAIEIDDAIADIGAMDDEMIGDATWYPCDENGAV